MAISRLRHVVCGSAEDCIAMNERQLIQAMQKTKIPSLHALFSSSFVAAERVLARGKEWGQRGARQKSSIGAVANEAMYFRRTVMSLEEGSFGL